MPSTLLFRAGLIVLLALVLNAPGLDRHELESEEARRLLPARSVLESASDRAVPQVWGRIYVNKPPLFYLLVAGVAQLESKLDSGGTARHLGYSRSYMQARREILLQRFLNTIPPGDRFEYQKRIELPRDASPDEIRNYQSRRSNALTEIEGLMVNRQQPQLPELALVSPISARWAALLASIATGLALLFAGRWLAPGAGFVAACVYLCMPEVLSKSVLGEIETTFALLYFVGTICAWFGIERRHNPATILGGLILALATLTKGPFALLFSIPALVIWAATRSYRRPALIRVFAIAVLATIPFVLWYLHIAGATGMGDQILERWQQEAARGGTGGLARWLQDRWQLVAGVIFGWLPASLVVLGSLRSNSTRSWRTLPVVKFTHLTLLIGLLVLAVWPGVRARYALPLAPWAALMAGGILVAATRGGATLAWSKYADRSARIIGLFMSWFAPLVALVLSIAWLVGPDSIIPGNALNFGHVLFLWLLVLFARLALTDFERPDMGRWLFVALILAVGLRWVERSAIEAGRPDNRERAAGALWLSEAIDVASSSDNQSVAIDEFGQFNLLAYAGQRFEWTDAADADALSRGQLLVTERERGLKRVESGAWEMIFPPAGGLGLEAWRRISDLRSLVLLRRQ